MLKKIALLIGIFTATVSYSAPSVEEIFFDNLRRDTLATLQADNISRDDKIVRISQLIKQNIASLQVGRSVLGQPWRKLTKPQKIKYIKTFELWVSDVLAKRLIGFELKNDLVINKTYTGGNGVVVIRTTTKNEKTGGSIVLDWYVRKIKDKPKLIDVAVANVSMISTQRAEFTALYSTGGIDGLIKKMKSQMKSK